MPHVGLSVVSGQSNFHFMVYKGKESIVDHNNRVTLIKLNFIKLRVSAVRYDGN